MKRFVTILVAVVLAAAGIAAAAEGVMEQKKKVLVVYYSYSGHTQQAAQMVADACGGADMRRIEESLPRSKTSAYTAGCRDAMRGKASAIKPMEFNCDGYDLVFIGSPMWAWNQAPAVNGFIEQANLQGKNVVVFYTMDGKGEEKPLERFSATVRAKGAKVVGSFAIRWAKRSVDEIRKEVDEKVAPTIK